MGVIGLGPEDELSEISTWDGEGGAQVPSSQDGGDIGVRGAEAFTPLGSDYIGGAKGQVGPRIGQIVVETAE